MLKAAVSLGARGEELAAGFLRGNGYAILCRNYRNRLGEIDIVALDKGVFCFVEVKTRASKRFGSGKEAVFPAKQGQMIKVATCFLKERQSLDKRARFDVVSVDLCGPEARIELIKNAFDG